MRSAMDNVIELNIATEFSKYPGPRFRKEGNYSGEEFRENFLEKKFAECIKNDCKLIINLDGGAGYGTSFLEEAFGGLARIYESSESLLNRIEFISNEEPYLIEDINEYITNALQ